VKNWPDEDLILFLYREQPRAAAIERDLESDAGLRERLATLRRDLARFDETAPPTPREGFEARLWARLRPRLDESAPRPFGAPLAHRRRWALALLIIAALAGAFFAGRRSTSLPRAAGAAATAVRPFTAGQRERLLRAALAGHLEKASLLLTDLAHAPAGQDLGDERRWAASLLESNRLYRSAAERAGQRRIVALLDELDPLLVELANAPGEGEVAPLQERIDRRDLLFKVRVVGQRLQTNDL